MCMLLSLLFCSAFLQLSNATCSKRFKEKEIILETDEKYGRYNTDAEFPQRPLIMQDDGWKLNKNLFGSIDAKYVRNFASKWDPPKWGTRDLRWNYLVGLNQKVLYPLGPILDPDIMLVENEENLILHLRTVDLRQKLSLSDHMRQNIILETVQKQLKRKQYKNLFNILIYNPDFSSIYDWKQDFYGALVKALTLRLFTNPLIQIVKMRNPKILSIFLKGQEFHQKTLDAALQNVIDKTLECECYELYVQLYDLYILSKLLQEKGADASKRLKNLRERKDETESCPICMDKCEKMLVRECDHMFCEMCDTKLLKKKCPFCRKKSTRPSIEYQRLVNKIEKLNK